MRRASILALLLVSCSLAAHAAVPADCWALRKHGHAAQAQSCFDGLTQSGNAYYRAEGFWGLEEWEQAKSNLRLALKQANSPALWRVRYGMLFHERFNDKDAGDLFQEALKMDPQNAQAYLGMAELSTEGFDSKASEYAAKAIALDPKLAEAHEAAGGSGTEQ